MLSLRKPWRILLLVVGLSAALRLRAAESIPTPWIAPDELTYAELGRSFWQTGKFAILGTPTAFFSVLYPLLAGLPLSLGDRETGYELVKTLNAVVISLTALPVYLWGRELVSRRWALVAAAITLAAPCLAYAGLIMTLAGLDTGVYFEPCQPPRQFPRIQRSKRMSSGTDFAPKFSGRSCWCAPPGCRRSSSCLLTSRRLPSTRDSTETAGGCAGTFPLSPACCSWRSCGAAGSSGTAGL